MMRNEKPAGPTLWDLIAQRASAPGGASAERPVRQGAYTFVEPPPTYRYVPAQRHEPGLGGTPAARGLAGMHDAPDRLEYRPGPIFPANRRFKGTTFFGGAGMDGDYIGDFVAAFGEAGISNVRAADPTAFSTGKLGDQVASLSELDRDDEIDDLSRIGEAGEQLNLVGYSYGGQQAAQVAADVADHGHVVDHLVLIATPISTKFLNHLRSHPNIRRVKIVDLTEHGDSIHAGMSARELLDEIPFTDWAKVNWLGDRSGPGHFYYGDDAEEGSTRRRELAHQLHRYGLR